MTSVLIDTHTHLYVDEFKEDIDDIVQRAIDAGVEKMLMPNIDASTIEPMNMLAARYSKNCFPMIGLHPCSVKADFEEELRIIETALRSPLSWGEGSGVRLPIAIGETGLDYYWNKTFIEQQKEALRIQIGWAKEFGIPIVLHSRDSFDDLVSLITEHHDEKLKGVFHCFTGTVEEAQRVISLPNFYLGIGGVVTYKNTVLRETLGEIGLERVVLETDSPYLAPVPYRGKRNESGYLRLMANQVAGALGITVEDAAEATTQNARALFGLQ